MINTSEDRKKVADAIQEISNSMTRIDAEKDLIKDIVDATRQKFEIDKKHVRKLASSYHKQNMTEVKNEYDEVESLYQEIFE